MKYRYFVREYGNNSIEYYRIPKNGSIVSFTDNYEYYSNIEQTWNKGTGRGFNHPEYKKLSYAEFMLEMI